jgi:hypothetical protein
MKRQEYNTINSINQASSLIKDAILLAERTEGFFHKQLFQTENSYLEVYRHTHFNVIIKVVRFTDTSLLEPYLEGINIDELLK